MGQMNTFINRSCILGFKCQRPSFNFYWALPTISGVGEGSSMGSCFIKPIVGAKDLILIFYSEVPSVRAAWDISGQWVLWLWKI